MFTMTMIFALVALAGLFYGWYQRGHAQIQADEKFYQKIHNLEVQRGLLELRCLDAEQDLKRANARIELLNSKLVAGRPVGALMKRNTQVLKQQELVRNTDPTTTTILPRVPHVDDLPPMQLL